MREPRLVNHTNGGRSDREASGVGPARVAPAVTQAACGPVAATDQNCELVDRDRVLFPDEAEQFPVPAHENPDWAAPERLSARLFRYVG
jgi:hypothetical protein